MADSGEAEVYRGNLDRLISKVNEERGIDLGQYRRAYLERRIGTRMRFLGLDTYRKYATHLDRCHDEYRLLLDALTINVTGFFRDQVVWDSLRIHVVEPLVETKKRGHGRTIRAWSAGCATGEEPYSLAMLLIDSLGEEYPAIRASVLGTDLDPAALQRAEAGVFPAEKLTSIPAPYRMAYTRAGRDSTFRVSSDVQRAVRFAQVSLFDPPPLKVVDLIMCRNVFIYLDKQQQERVLDVFWETLTRGGCLVLGRSEKLSVSAVRKYEAVDGKERIYRKPISR